MARDGTPARRDQPSSWPRRLAWPRRPAHPVLAVAIGTGLAVYAWVDGSAVPFSRGALVGVLIPGAVLAVIAVGRPPERIPPPDGLDIARHVLLADHPHGVLRVGGVRLQDNSWPWHPSFTDLVTPLLGPHLVKSAAILVWMLAGWALVRR